MCIKKADFYGVYKIAGTKENKIIEKKFDAKN